MLLHTKPSSKRASPTYQKLKIQRELTDDDLCSDADYLSIMRRISADKMQLARHVVTGEGILIVLLLLGAIAICHHHNHLNSAFLEFALVMSTTMVVHAVWLWRKTRRFFLKYHQE